MIFEVGIVPFVRVSMGSKIEANTILNHGIKIIMENDKLVITLRVLPTAY